MINRKSLQRKAKPFNKDSKLIKENSSLGFWSGSVITLTTFSPYGGIGRRPGLKNPCPYGRVGSSPTGGMEVRKMISKNDQGIWCCSACESTHVCYCLPGFGDPICDCGEPAFACRCEELRRKEEEEWGESCEDQQ